MDFRTTANRESIRSQLNYDHRSLQDSRAERKHIPRSKTCVTMGKKTVTIMITEKRKTTTNISLRARILPRLRRRNLKGSTEQNKLATTDDTTTPVARLHLRLSHFASSFAAAAAAAPRSLVSITFTTCHTTAHISIGSFCYGPSIFLSLFYSPFPCSLSLSLSRCACFT